ncbi:MAG: ABC transporter permease [Christensenellales bacterium]|jgi:putative aldouronate transport system permease protein
MQRTFLTRIVNDLSRNRHVYIMAIPMVIYYILFHYVPMYGAVIAFKHYSPGLGISNSPWVGFTNFRDFFENIYFFRLIRNTLLINIKLLLFGFPIPIIFAILINEIRATNFRRTVQTISYLPHFISTMVICGMIIDFTRRDGIIPQILSVFGVPQSNLLLQAENFHAIYVVSDIWQGMGWNSIIYIAAIMAIDPQLYEAAEIDGAKRFRKMVHVTLPGIMQTIIILLILRVGQIMSLGFEKIILLYNPNTYETADVISSYVYRKGLIDFNYSYSTAVGLFNSIINFAFLLFANTLSRKLNETSLW